jgi:hypothetical protein
MTKNVYVSEALVVPPRDDDRDFYRADLQFHGLDHSNASYEGRVFVNRPRVDASTPLDSSEGYAGSYFVFGHAGCWGDEGHCEIPKGPLTAYDLRPPHELEPQLAVLPVTDQVRALDNEARKAVRITVLAVPAESAPPLTFADVEDDVLRFERLVLVTYDQ